MITPRRTRLVRVPGLHEFRHAIETLTIDAPGTFVLVPTRGAAVHLSRTMAPLEHAALVTRDEFHDALLAHLPGPPRRLTLFEREGMMQAAAAAIDAPPFPLRAGLVAEMIRFYDELRRQSQTVRRFLELMEERLAGGAGDRGAERLLIQTRFLAAAFEGYEARVAASDALDEHGVRQRALAAADDAGVRQVVVTLPDWIADPNGLFATDFELLARLPGLETIDCVCTEAVLGSGFHERLHGWWPGLEEEDGLAAAVPRVRPTLAIPKGADPDVTWFTCRDREEELLAVARRLSASASGEDRERVGIVFKQPLPYLYLASDTLGRAGIPFQLTDALPLAAEPAVAALDLVLDVAETGFTRPALVALLRSPHVRLLSGADAQASLADLDRWLSRMRYLGDIARLEAITDAPAAAAAALAAARAVARSLLPLLETAPASAQLRLLCAVLDGWYPPLAAGDPFAARDARARAAVRDTLVGLADAHAAHHDPDWTLADLAAAVRRAIGEQTFEPERTGHGVHLLDDRAARYARLDDVTIVGLVDQEWPERPRRNIFYTPALLKALGWPSERDRRGAGEARFLDLVAGASVRTALSTITLDDEALVSRSMLLDEVPRARLSMAPIPSAPPGTPVPETPPESPEIPAEPHRLATDPAYHGSLGPQQPRAWSVSAVETYLDCPFKFFAQHVLRLREEPEEEEVMDPRRQGQFVHEVFETFFQEWKAAGHQAVTPGNLPGARRLFADVVDRALVRLPGSEAGLERTRLLGSPAAAGLGEAVLRMEAERPVAVIDRLLEHPFKRDLQIDTDAGPRTVAIRGKADRLDLLADGTFRLIDYKLGWPPNRSRALQLPIYGLAASQQLSADRGRPWVLGEAVYLAFKGPRRVVPLFATAAERDEVLARAQQRLSDALDAIERGEFPPRPDDVYRCETCSFTSVCRKDYV